jgi:hypothetical protein
LGKVVLSKVDRVVVNAFAFHLVHTDHVAVQQLQTGFVK